MKKGVEHGRPRNRVGLFGGTFDPVHQGHLAAAEKVKNAFAMKAVVFIPSAVPPHKEGDKVTRASDRLAMLQLAVTGTAGFSISECEIRRPGPSYTIDTIRFFKENTPGDTRLYWIMGHDAFLEMTTWKAYREILAQIPLIVMHRRGIEPPSKSSEGGGSVEMFIVQELSSEYSILENDSCYVHPSLHPIHLFRDPLPEISATRIRKNVKTGKRIRNMVPGAVEAYILEKRLYR